MASRSAGLGPTFRGNLAHPHPNPSPASQERGWSSASRHHPLLLFARWSPSTPCTAGATACATARGRGRSRSEEHTSELQSLMRLSYAVFCLKKQQYHKLHTRTIFHIPKTHPTL